MRQFAFSDGLRGRVRNGWRAYPVCGRFVRLWLVLNVQAAFKAPKQFKAACTFSGSPKGAWAAIDRLTSGLRSFEQKPRACVPHTPYIGIGGFVRATACYVGTEGFVQATACYIGIGGFIRATACLFKIYNISL